MIWAIRQVIPKLFGPLHRDRKDTECPQYYIKEGGIYWFQSLKALTLCLYFIGMCKTFKQFNYYSLKGIIRIHQTILINFHQFFTSP